MPPGNPVVAHGAAGGADELIFFLAAGLLVLGVVRLVDRTARGRARVMGAALLVLGLVLGAVPVALRLGAPRQAKIRPTTSARLTIIEPEAGSRVRGRTVAVALRLEGARITNKTTTRLRPDEGHVHISIDGFLVSRTGGLKERVGIGDLAPGRHALQAEFVAADHGRFRPPVLAFINFVVVR
jgi:hypothetical protein